MARVFSILRDGDDVRHAPVGRAFLLTPGLVDDVEEDGFGAGRKVGKGDKEVVKEVSSFNRLF